MAAALVRKLGLFTLASAVTLGAVGCKKPDKRSNKRTVKATIAEFDPSKMSVDLDAYGTERADDWEVSQAFNRSFDGLDKCVVEAKKRRGVGDDEALAGDVDFAVQLDPKSKRPMAVNAELSEADLNKDDKLKDCLRDAVADVGFPTYDGPPQVAEFYTQLDPGSDYEE
jgi:hypothetical protein